MAESDRQAGPKNHPGDKYIIVNKLMEAENNMDLRRPGFVGISKYEVNRDELLPYVLIEDKYCRVGKKMENCKYPPYEIDKSIMEVAKALRELINEIKYVMIEESYRLGEKMGLRRDLLKEVVQCNCGISWV